MTTIETQQTPHELIDDAVVQGLGAAEIRQKLVDTLGIAHATAANEHLAPYQQKLALLGALGLSGTLADK